MNMENKHANKDRSEDHGSVHPGAENSEGFQDESILIPEDIEDANELVDESAQLTSKQPAFV